MGAVFASQSESHQPVSGRGVENGGARRPGCALRDIDPHPSSRGMTDFSEEI